jgi:hypothetical protein
MCEAIGAGLGMIVGIHLAEWLNRIASSHGIAVGIFALVVSAVTFLVLMIGGGVLGNAIKDSLDRR